VSQNIELKNFELATVNPSNKTWTSADLFCYWANSIQTIAGFALISSLYLIYNLSSYLVLSSSIAASILVYFFISLIGHPSQKHGLPFPVLMRMSMGLNGARYLSLLRSIVGIFMFGIQTYFISKSITYLTRIIIYYIFDPQILESEFFLEFFLGLNVIDWFSLIVTFFIQFFLFTNGQRYNQGFLKFSAIFVYFGLIFFFIMLIAENSTQIFQSLKSNTTNTNLISKSNVMPFFILTGTIFSYFSIVLLNYGDFSRYVKTSRDLKIGNLFLFLNMIVFSFLATTIVIGVDVLLNQKLIVVDQIMTRPMDIIGKIDNVYLTVYALIFIIFSSLSTNLITNYVPTQNSIINFLPKNLDLKSAGILILIFGLITGSLWPSILSQIEIIKLIDSFAAFFGPIFGVIIADYYLVKKEKVNHKDLFFIRLENEYIYSGGWNYKAVYAVLIGFIFSFSIIWNINFEDFKTFSWIIGFVVSYIMYYLLNEK
jgi:NCS1 family nucleobase:cation symporter-1